MPAFNIMRVCHPCPHITNSGCTTGRSHLSASSASDPAPQCWIPRWWSCYAYCECLNSGWWAQLWTTFTATATHAISGACWRNTTPSGTACPGCIWIVVKLNVYDQICWCGAGMAAECPWLKIFVDHNLYCFFRRQWDGWALGQFWALTSLSLCWYSIVVLFGAGGSFESWSQTTTMHKRGNESYSESGCV